MSCFYGGPPPHPYYYPPMSPPVPSSNSVDDLQKGIDFYKKLVEDMEKAAKEKSKDKPPDKKGGGGVNPRDLAWFLFFTAPFTGWLQLQLLISIYHSWQSSIQTLIK